MLMIDMFTVMAISGPIIIWTYNDVVFYFEYRIKNINIG